MGQVRIVTLPAPDFRVNRRRTTLAAGPEAKAEDMAVAGRTEGVRTVGRGRRRWVRPLLAGCAMALVAGSALAVRQDMANDPDTGGYPQRIGFDRPSDALPDRADPLAGTLFDNDFGAGRMLGVTSTGSLWELPPGVDALSPSGTKLLTQRWNRQRLLEVRDLASGTRSVLRGSSPWWSLGRARVFWSPDEDTVLGDFAPTARRDRRRPALLDLATGVLSAVGSGEPAGFRSASEVVTVRRLGGPTAPDGIVAITTDLRSGTTIRVPLRLAGPWRGDPGPELVASVAPDGQTVLLVEADSGRSTDSARMFSLADGSEVSSRTIRNWDGCTPTWLGGDPVLPTTQQPGGSGTSRWAGAALLTESGSRSLVAVHPRLQSTCLQLTATALETGPRWALFGTSTAWWAWYWFPAAVVTALALVGSLLVIWTLRRPHTGGPGRVARRRPGWSTQYLRPMT